MSANRELVRRWIEELDARNLEVYDELLAPGAVVHWPNGLDLQRDEAIEAEEAFYRAFSNVRHMIQELVVERDLVVLRETVSAKHTGTYLEIPPTNEQVALSAILIFRIEHDKIAEIWAEADLAGFAQRLAECT